MPPAANSHSTSLSPASRAAARARMRELAAAAAAAKTPELDQADSKNPVGSDEPSSSRHSPRSPAQIPSSVINSPLAKKKEFDAAAQKRHNPSYSTTSRPPEPHPAQTSRPEQDFRPLSYSREDIDRPLVLNRSPKHEDEMSEQGSSLGRGRSMRVKVKLYHGEDKGEFDRDHNRDLPTDYDIDSPYIPGSASTNNLRCITWLRNVPRNPDGYYRPQESNTSISRS